MRRFVAKLLYAERTDFINIEADKMTLAESYLTVWRGEELAALVDMGAIVEAHMSDGDEKQPNNVQMKDSKP